MAKVYQVSDIVNIKPNFSAKLKMFFAGTRHWKDNTIDGSIVSVMIIKVNNEGESYNVRFSDDTIGHDLSAQRFLPEQGIDYDALIAAIAAKPILYNSFGHPMPGCICDGMNRCKGIQ